MTLQDARVVVTGGAGFIGSHLVDRLVADNEVLVVARAITAEADHNVFDLRTRTTTSVDRIADIVADEMGLEPAYAHTGGERGWTGDVPRMRLSVEKLAGLGWEPSQSSDEAVRQSTRELLAEL